MWFCISMAAYFSSTLLLEPFWLGRLRRRPARHRGCRGTPRGALSGPLRKQRDSERGEVLPRGVGTLRHFLILSDNSACQGPICAVAA